MSWQRTVPEGGKSRKARNAGLGDAGNSFGGWTACLHGTNKFVIWCRNTSKAIVRSQPQKHILRA
ncbi:MAG: hypothetical protein CMF04_11595 [Hyphomonas sp.]|nr:hypothetical protein [Hyphomonas sp.]